jgi:hypothetical protein
MIANYRDPDRVISTRLIVPNSVSEREKNPTLADFFICIFRFIAECSSDARSAANGETLQASVFEASPFSRLQSWRFCGDAESE